MKKHIVMVAHFADVDDNNGNGRFTYIADMLKDRFDVTFITSDFNHTRKEAKNEKNIDKPYKVILAHEPPYRKNISLTRIKNHKTFGGNVKKVLEQIPTPDAIYCAVPSLDAGKICSDYCNAKSIPFIIDIQDIWPEAFKLIFDFPIFNQIVYGPMYKIAEYIYESADQIIGVSQTYVDLALKYNKKVSEGYSIYLGTELSKFDEIAGEANTTVQSDEFRITYIGTLGHSYNIKCIIDALHEFDKEGQNNITFLIMGDGPLQYDFERYAKKKQVRVDFMGRLPYREMVAELAGSDIAVNPIKKGASQSIINKVGDYAAAGLPVINTQENPEYRNAVEDYGFGINCDNDNIQGIKEGIKKIYTDDALRSKMRLASRKYAEERFDRSKTYPQIIDILGKFFQGI